MAQSLVNFYVNTQKKLSGTLVKSNNRFSTCSTYVNSVSSDYSLERKTDVSTFEFNLNFAETSVINAINLYIRSYLTKGYGDLFTPNGGITAIGLLLDGDTYAFDSAGNLLDTSIIAKLNNYKNQNGVFPDVVLKVETWVERPKAPSEEGNANESSICIELSYAVVSSYIEGGALMIMPNYDISVEHDIPEGFNGVYALINETVADNDETYIGVKCNSGDSGKDEFVEKNSVVGSRCDLSKKKIVSARTCMVSSVSAYNSIYVARGDLDLQVYCAGNSSTVIVGNPVLDEGGADAAKTGYELLVGFSDNLVSAINSYKRSEGNQLDIKFYIKTSAKSTYNMGKSDGSSSYVKVTQVYLLLIYEDITNIGIFDKVNDTYKAASDAYKKDGGTWVEITENECKVRLKNNNILRG